MPRTWIALPALAAAMLAVPAAAQGSYQVRNDTGQRVHCVAQRPAGGTTIAVELAPDGEWVMALERRETHVLVCRNGARRQTLRMVSGKRHALQRDRSGALRLRTLN